MGTLLYDILSEKLNMLETGQPDVSSMDKRQLGIPVEPMSCGDRFIWLQVYDLRDKVLKGESIK